MTSTGADARLGRLWRLWLHATNALIVVGALGAVAGWRPAAWFLVAVVTGGLAVSLAIGAAAYKQTMRRPWPRVEPVRDDDW